MEAPKFTVRGAAKYVVTAVVAGKISDIAADAMTDYTRFEEDDKIVDISSHLIGWAISSQLKPVTDYAVDKTANFVAAKYAEYKANKETKTEETEK